MSSIEVTTFTYRHGDVELAGYMAQPSRYPRAAILIVPTIAGPNQIMFDRAKWLASIGYSAMVCDIYGKGEITDMQEGRRLAGELRADPEYYRERFRCALDELRVRSKLANHRLAAIGYCMGGEIVLEMARGGEDLALVVSFHGLLATPLPAKRGTIIPRVLVCHGRADPLVPPKQVRAFLEEMDIAGANCHMHIYSGVVHGFTDPASNSKPLDAVSYDASADRQSKAAMLSMFDELFGPEKTPAN
ncbi:dienelactone hydrolase family protein [Parasphingorhabdus halotolerans]|uniref:Dienelactone hydrolase family protein n=1 Tax=Parasphingorhabdus halotolerans TaxID=2725558 RepID=A0A6H2DJM4_9SPHN|nr:dienelactone hydrolase family protein [Parasphingorhabdus halotolerans]QJB67951.1 dienelactone hydrolase family protein [Parasphingorhabdus halotolerans]